MIQLVHLIDIDPYLAARIYVNEVTGCWEWMKFTHKGYGRVYWQGNKSARAHRAIYEHVRGAIPVGLTLDHLCRMTQCVYPYHLEAVDHRTNVLRGVGPTAVNAAKTKCSRGHDFDIAASGRRVCRQCAIRRAREADERKRRGTK